MPQFVCMFRFVTALELAILLLLLTNASMWFFSSDTFCRNIFSEVYLLKSPHGKEKRDTRGMGQLEETMARIKKAELALDRLLSQLPAGKKVRHEELPVIFGITPTYSRPTQKADLTRLCQTLQHVLNFHWIVVEDSEFKTELVSRFLLRCGVNYTHFAVRTSLNIRQNGSTPRWTTARGMKQRNSALQWIRSHFNSNRTKGIVYFMDDDNTYDVEIFKQMRWTGGVSVWPVGLVAGLRWEGPICENKKVVGFRVAYKPMREFPLDMAGFALNAKLIVNNPRLEFSPNVDIGLSESAFLSQITTRQELEPLANQCTKVLVWHTRTAKAKLHREILLKGEAYEEIEV